MGLSCLRCCCPSTNRVAVSPFTASASPAQVYMPSQVEAIMPPSGSDPKSVLSVADSVKRIAFAPGVAAFLPTALASPAPADTAPSCELLPQSGGDLGPALSRGATLLLNGAAFSSSATNIATQQFFVAANYSPAQLPHQVSTENSCLGSPAGAPRNLHASAQFDGPEFSAVVSINLHMKQLHSMVSGSPSIFGLSMVGSVARDSSLAESASLESGTPQVGAVSPDISLGFRSPVPSPQARPDQVREFDPAEQSRENLMLRKIAIFGE